MDGCSAPLVVKFADTQKEKEQKKMQQMQANLWNLAAANINIGQAATTVAPQMIPNPPQQPSPILAADAISPSFNLLQQLQAVGLQHQILQGKYYRWLAGLKPIQIYMNTFLRLVKPKWFRIIQREIDRIRKLDSKINEYFFFFFAIGLNAQSESAAAAAAAGLLPSMNIQNLAALAAMTQPSMTAATQQPSAQLTNAAALLCKYS